MLAFVQWGASTTPTVKLACVCHNAMDNLNHNLVQIIDLASSDKIQELCQPLALLDISYFLYIKKFKNGRELFLTNNGEWERFFLENELYKDDYFRFAPNYYPTGIYLWSAINCQSIYKYAIDFNIGHGFTMVERTKHYTEYWHFGANIHKPSSVLNDILNNMDLIKRFMGYLKNNARGTLTELAAKLHNKNILPKDALSPELTNDTAKNNGRDLRESFLQMINTDRYYLMLDGNENYFTKQEMACLNHLKNGLTAGEIASALDLSKRTVETHVDNIKIKSNCNKQFQLGYLLAKSGFI